MIDSLSPYVAVKNYSQIMPAARSAASAKVKDEFLAIFYKELLKQVFKTPNLSLGEENEQNNSLTSFNSDLMVEQLAQQLARDAFAGMQWLPTEEGK